MRRRCVALVAVLAACGPSGGEQDAAAILEPQIGEIRAAAGDGDRTRAQQELDELRATVRDLRRSDDLTEQEANQILEAADEVERYLRLIKPPRPTPVERSPSPTPTPRPTEPERTPEPTPTQPPEPSPTQPPQPTQSPEPPDNNTDGSGDEEPGGVPGIL